MIALPRRTAHLRLLLVLGLAVAVLAVACGLGPEQSRSPTRGPSSSAPAPSLTAVPGGVASLAVSPPTTTVTEFGTIYDSLPPSFPKLPGQEPADTGGGATSGSFAIPNLSAVAAAAELRAALTEHSWIVDVGSPLEDGTVVLQATRGPGGCKTEVRFTPRSGTVVMSVLYGASCPFS